MITFSSQIADSLGYLTLKESPKSKKIRYSRRVNRVATLDGKSALSDQGFTHSDNTVQIKVDNISERDILILKRLITLYPLIIYSEENGVFLGVISEFDFNKMPLNITFLVSEQIS